MFKTGWLRFGVVFFFLLTAESAWSVCNAPSGGTAQLNSFGDCEIRCPAQYNLSGGACVYSGAGSYTCGVRTLPFQGLPGGTGCGISSPCGANRVQSPGMNDCTCASGYILNGSGTACVLPGGGGAGSGTSGGSAPATSACSVGDRCTNGTLTGSWDGSACCTSGPTAVCLAPPITCSPPPRSCNVGDRCTNGSLTGSWDGSACCTSGPTAACLAPPISCSAAPTPSPTPPLGASCTNGWSCGPCPSRHTCTYDSAGNCCIDQTAQVCLASWSTCSAPPAPTATPNCNIGDSCTGAGGTSGVWFAGAGNPCCGSGGGCCQVDRNGNPMSCLLGPFACSAAPVGSPSPTATPTPIPGLPLCAVNDVCTPLGGHHVSQGVWSEFCTQSMSPQQCFNCCLDHGGCLSGPFQECVATATPPPPPPSFSNCSVGAACQDQFGSVGLMSASMGCCASGKCFDPPYVCPPVIGFSATPTPPADPFADPVIPSQCRKGFSKSGGSLCRPIPDYHSCATPASSLVMPSVPGTEDIRNFLNPKLKCCLNEIDGAFTSGSHLKFDCIENAGLASNFDTLWAGKDQDVNGSAPYATLLAGFGGKPISGFYALESGSLRRCGEFSEFAALGPIQGFRVDPAQTVVQQNSVGAGQLLAVGSALPVPQGVAFTHIRTEVRKKGKTIPTTVDEVRRCPVLLRAATVVSCKKSGAGQVPPKTYTDSTASADKVRCTSGSVVQIHVQLRQLHEITGQPTMKTVDTVVDSSQLSTISVEEILKQRRTP